MCLENFESVNQKSSNIRQQMVPIHTSTDTHTHTKSFLIVEFRILLEGKVRVCRPLLDDVFNLIDQIIFIAERFDVIAGRALYSIRYCLSFSIASIVIGFASINRI